MRTIKSALARGWQLLRLLSDPETLTRIGIAAQRYDTSRFAVVKRIIKLYMAERFYPLESLANGLANPRSPFELHWEYFSRERLHGLQIAVNSRQSSGCRDKLLFHAYCCQYALPVPELYGVLSRHGSRDNAGNSLDVAEQFIDFIKDTLPASVIAKPRGGNKGRGILLLSKDEIGCSTGDINTLCEELQMLANGDEDYLLQQRLLIHPQIKALTSTDAISTIRVVTFVPFGGTPRIMAAMLRAIAHDSITDNISDFETGGYSGNLLASIDITTGVVQWALSPNKNGVDREFVENHPRSGRPLVGFQIPLWNDVQELCTRAAGFFLPLRAIGWDVAITPSGPVLIEANELFQFSAFGSNVADIRAALQAEMSRLKPRPK